MLKDLKPKDLFKLLLPPALVFTGGYLLMIEPLVELFLVSLYIYLVLSPKMKPRPNYPLYILLLFLIAFAFGHFASLYNLPLVLLPFCIVPMLATILFNEIEISLILSLAAAAAVAPFYSWRLEVFLILASAGIISFLLVKDIRRRTSIIRAGLILGGFQTLLMFVFNRVRPDNYFFYPLSFLNGIFCGIIVIGVLPIFEYLFKTVTNISLLEMADFNHPLLQRMIMEAPGTYHHSLIVGNLSEAACQAIGANSLLARIGAYYHDIGKLSKPEYFSENQGFHEGNKHDELPATMSKLVIMNHINEGVDLAAKYKLNPVLVDFIRMHHGNSLVYYFYRRALENSHNNEEVQEEGFRYPGPKPTTKETAIVLLADSVEAATRTLKEPTFANITETVHKIINNKFIDGQLDNCDLTLKNLDRIASVFIRIFSAIYHSRITYPSEK